MNDGKYKTIFKKLVLTNRNNFLEQFQIRINGYLYRLVSLSAGQEKKLIIPHLATGYQVTVDEVEEDINMLLPENATYYDRDFFKTLAVDDVVDWRYDDGTLEADKVKHSEVPVDDEILYG
jgi:hypothetical protein